jgi:hypothetical protein
MDNSGKRLGIVMLTVVVVLALNVFAVLSGAADDAYGRLFGFQIEQRMAVEREPTSAAAPAARAVECEPCPRHAQRQAIPPGAGVTVGGAPVARLC